MDSKEVKKGSLNDKIDDDVKSIDPTSIGGLDSNSAPNLEDEALNWTKSRGKKKE